MLAKQNYILVVKTLHVALHAASNEKFLLNTILKHRMLPNLTQNKNCFLKIQNQPYND